jgi:predicted AlkP superfamily phosphohydrolase/phosphomutase
MNNQRGRIVAMSTRKVLVIGLDGATFKLIKPWISQGKLPNIARLMREGVHGDLESTPDMMSPAAWTSFSTGKNPGKHGIYNFMDLVPGTLKLRYLNSGDRNSETTWSLLNKAGKKVVVLNVPMTYPADKVNGAMISGWNAPTIKSRGFSEPPELIDQLVSRFGDYELFPVVKKHISENNPGKGVKALHRYMDLTASAAQYLMKTMTWDFFCVVFLATDQVQHYYWHYMDENHPQFDAQADPECRNAVFAIYEKCDRVIGDLIQMAGKDSTVIVMSDHGSGMNHGALQYLPVWLLKMGFAAEKKPGSKNPFVATARASKHLFIAGLKWGYNVLNRRLSVKMKGLLNTLLPVLRDKVETTWRFASYDWSNTTVYFHYEPRINLKGRDPFGVVSPGKDYEKVRNHLIAKLYECCDAKTGEPVVDKVFKGEEVYPHSGHSALTPDIVIRWRKDLVISGLASTDDRGRKIVVTDKNVSDQRTGNHEPSGIFIAQGPALKNNGTEVHDARIIDLAPTILTLFGQPIPADMDGNLLVDIFNKDYLRDNAPQHAAEADSATSSSRYSDDEEARVCEHLKDLGYME